MMSNMNNIPTSENCALIHKIQAEDFALYETALYLDGHPNDTTALDFYDKHRDAAVHLREEYNKKYGPLTIYDGADQRHWHWTDNPFPWEKEAN